MSRHHHIAHGEHMLRLFGTAAPTQPLVEPMRRQLGELADHIGASIAEAAARPAEDKLEVLALRLQGAARLALSLRAAIHSTATASE